MERTALPALDAQRVPVIHAPWVTAFGIGFIEQPMVIEKIRTHLGPWPALPQEAAIDDLLFFLLFLHLRPGLVGIEFRHGAGDGCGSRAKVLLKHRPVMAD